MTTNKVCGKGKCKFTDEFCASGDCPYDTENMLKNQQNFNTSEGNVKDDNIKSGKTKHGDFIVKYLEEGSHYKVKEINVMENVAQRNSQDLTELWKKGKLPIGRYYIKDINDETYVDYYVNNGFIIGFEDFFDDEIKEVLAPVPSYEEYEVMKYRSSRFSVRHFEVENQNLKEKLEPFTDPYFKGLTTKDIAELAKKSIRLTKQSCEDNTTIQRLKELLCYCADVLEEMDDKDRDIEILLEEVNEVLK
jgi:hypothetical protein